MMDKMTFSIYAHKQLGAKCINDEWRFRRGERFFTIQIETDMPRRGEVGVLTHLKLYERIMPENENALREKVELCHVADTEAIGMSKEDITRWIYKQMLRAVLS